MKLIGPHEGRELELLLSGEKPIAMLYHAYLLEDPYFDEDSFDAHVDKGKIYKEVCFYSSVNDHRVVRYFFYYRPGERWRFLLLNHVQTMRWMMITRGDLWDEEIIGSVLGYSSRAVQAFLRRVRRRHPDVSWSEHDVSASPKLHRPRRRTGGSSRLPSHDPSDKSLIYPHRGQELDLMLAGGKGLAIFDHPAEEKPNFDEARFDYQVAKGRLFKRELYYCYDTRPRNFRCVYYFAPGEQWRYLAAELLVRQAWTNCIAVGPWWHEVMGGLLGYPEEAVRAFIRQEYEGG